MSTSLVRTSLVTALVAATVGLAGVASAAPPTCEGVRATIVGTPADDTLVGTPGRDVVWAGPGDDVVRAGAGDDLVCGNAGADELHGDAGDDRLLGLADALRVAHGEVVRVGDTLWGGPGDDRLDVGTDPRPAGGGVIGDRVSWSTSATAVRVDVGAGRASGEGADSFVARPHTTFVGSPLADAMTGSEGPDTILGGPGADVIDGLAGDDDLRPEGRDGATPADDDVVRGGDGDDWIRSRAGRDELSGGAGDDRVDSWSMLRAALHGDAGDDRLSVNLTRDGGGVLDGGAGADSAVLRRPGSRAPASAVLDLAAGTLSIAWPTRTSATVTGLESVSLAPGFSWLVLGTSSADHVAGAAGSRLRAFLRGGEDVVTGTGGDDLIDGGDGRDRADAGAGHDLCRAVEQRVSC